jgi:hypothetical protein
MDGVVDRGQWLNLAVLAVTYGVAVREIRRLDREGHSTRAPNRPTVLPPL